MITRSYKAIMARPIALLGLLAALAFGLLFLMPDAFAQVQTASRISYPENGTEPVVTLTASDPEGVRTTVWDLLTDASGDQDINGDGTDDVLVADVVDNDDFEISDAGVLTFASTPDFETPVDDGADNNYRVTVRASDGATGDPRGYYKVVVTVMDVNEPGKITWTVDPAGASEGTQELLQFQPGALITATLADPDNTTAEPIAGITWKWSGEGTVAPAADETQTLTSAYTVIDTPADKNDVGNTLSVTATYNDSNGDGKTATYTAPNPVQERRQDNVDPVFALDATTKTVPENTAAGMKIGTPVKATDGDDDILTYNLDTAGAGVFDIDRATGQLKTKAPLDHETTPTYTATVTATDSKGGTDTITVNINVTGVDDAPELMTAVTETKNVGRIEIPENQTVLNGDPDQTVDYAEPVTVTTAATYTGTDEEGGKVTLTTAGADGDLFELTDADTTDTTYTSTLAFKKGPDFEKPMDANKDNIYEVTVVATDPGGQTAMKYVTVKVTNVEEMGMVTLPGDQPVVGTAITATLTDSDIVSEKTVTWQWYRGSSADFTATDDPETGTAIGKATSDTYTPKPADKDMYLMARATYYDMTYAMGDAEGDAEGDADLAMAGITATDDPFMNKATSMSSLKIIANPKNSPPKFDDAMTERFVMEGTGSGMGIGDVVMATDPDAGQTLIYTLGGRDKDSFGINSASGQLMTKAMLDYETKKSYMVTVTADDSQPQDSSDSIMVTIYVTNVDEEPKVSGKDVIASYPENGKNPVTKLTASDPEGVRTTVWDLLTDASGDQDINGDGTDDVLVADVADNDDFEISDAGVLTFANTPDFENPNDEGPDNNYRVTVRASDGATSDPRGYYKVVVTVMDVNEPGKITWTVDPAGASEGTQELLQFQPGALITATLADPDNTNADPIAGITWKWSGEGTVTPAANETQTLTSAYTVTDSENKASDVGKRLSVTATYNDSNGDGKMATYTAPNPVQERRQDNTLPVFALDATTKTVPENTAAGMKIGTPVKATDGDDDILTYSLDTAGAGVFDIDRATGQLKTKAPLDHETTPTYTATVTATDSKGGADTITVNINVTGVDDAPELMTAVTETKNVGRIEIPENQTVLNGDPDQTVDYAEPVTVTTAATYTGTDEEGGKVTLTTAGADGDLFELTDADTTDTTYTSTLAFKKGPDFEKPMDANKDNIYEVTVVATDPGGQTAMKYVTVKVTNVEEMGMVTLPGDQPVVGTAITATLTDSDIVSEKTVTWQWYRGSSADFTATDDPETGTAIGKATSDTYTPKPADKDMYLMARATYYDMTYAMGDAEGDAEGDADLAMAGITATDDPFMNKATSMSSLKIIANPKNSPPKFDDAMTERFVMEGTGSGMGIGDVVMATDPDAGQTLIYTLGGRDKDSFGINSASGQLMTKAMLDYETKKSYMVTVTADDSQPQDSSDSIMVTIYVTNVDEEPMIMEGGLSISGSSSEDYAENGTDAVSTYTAVGPEAASARWTLEGDDAGDLRIGSTDGVLTFRSPPDFENPDDMGEDNVYRVTVKVTDGTNDPATREVTVTVTNVDELGTISSDPADVGDYAENGTDPVATYTADGPVSATWTLSGDDASDFTITGGVLAFSSASGPNFEMPMGGADGNSNTYRVTVQAAAGGETDEVPVTVTVTNVEELGTVSGDPDPIPDYPENGTSTVATYTTDGPVDAMWSLEGADAGAFSISGGMLTFSSPPNYENPADADKDNTYMVTVKAEAGGESDMATLTINVTDMSEAPMFAADMDTRSVAENTAAGENVGDPVMAIDEDEGDTLTYALSGDDAASFAIDAATGQIMVGEGTVLDFESEMTTYTVTVTATAGDGLSDMVTVTITVTNVNDQMPMFADEMAEFSVDENAAAGTVVGMVMAADDADSLMYSDDSMYFDVDESGQIVVAEGAMLDYEMDPMHTFTITASDGEDMDSITVTVTVTDMYPGCGTQGGDAANMYLNNDCEALLDSKDALGGSLNWSEALRINRWNGIQGHAMFPSLSGDPMRVTALHLQKKGLDGEIPDALGRLSGLTYLNLHSNDLQGTVPDALGSLTNLKRLYLNNNELDGSIGDLTGATSLEVLWLKSNQLTGGIPASLGSLSNLMNLRLFNNPDLRGSIPSELGSLSNLTHLVIQDTGLTGSIPTELGNLSNLVWLGLYNNALDGEIPMELGSLSNLEVLYLHNNMLSGAVPEELGNLSMLTNLWLKRNQLDGEIPASLGMLANLERVRINMNNFTGCVPAGLTDSAGIDSDAELLTHLETCP